MDLSSIQHQLHHHYLNHNHNHNHNHQQEMENSQSLDSIIAPSKQQEKESPNPNQKPRPAESEAQKCPRCDSANTKFCYYNNYSLSQPRYFCKACRRYWTKGGTLRNVPVGGGCRKTNKRPSSPSSFLIKKPHTLETHTPASVFFDANANANANGAMMPNPNGPNAFAFLDSLRYGEGFAGNVPFAETEGRALWGFPWQVMNYGDQIGAANTEWNGLIGNSAWQGLLNSPALI